MKLSIIICTRNRDFILQDCLAAILPQITVQRETELLLIDNGSTDSTREVVDVAFATQKRVKYIYEPKIGHSIAKNRAYQEASGEWVMYIDDDAKAHPDLIARAFCTINQYDFDAFGGQAIPWYRFGKPKWIPSSFGIVKKSTQVSTLVDGEYFSGMIMVIRKSILTEMQGFLSALGMSQTVGYGEETELQVRMKASGYIIGFDPFLVVEHCVLPHKLRLSWHLRSVYAHGRDGQKSKADKSPKEIIKKFCRTVITSLLFHLPARLVKVFFHKNYYWQNAVLDSLSPPLTWAGRLEGVIKSRRRS